MKKLKKVKIKSFSSLSGKLIPYTFTKNFPIKVKRIFFLYGKKNKIRGDHAHKKCSQLFVAISGKMLLEVKLQLLPKRFQLMKKKNMVS